MTLHDKKGRPIEARDFVIEIGHEQRYEVEKTGRKYVTVRLVREDGTVAPTALQFECWKVLVVKQVDGEWVTDWDKPRPKPGRRLAWGESDDFYKIHTGFINRVPVFSITWGTHKGASTNLLGCVLPGYTKKTWPVKNHEAGEELAEKLWVAWLQAMGAAPIEKENDQ
ncbi:hypothetical protein [Microbispora sp. NPDC049633]|uniref:hypothetical protein n=1 Tax=Microbispora sp. NPDC049633 TaxID=3154355 RepID=UPI00343874D6